VLIGDRCRTFDRGWQGAAEDGCAEKNGAMRLLPRRR
jgi:hypothetical protein